jgi:hypothetical protein
MNLILKPDQVDIYNIKYITNVANTRENTRENTTNTNIIYKSPFFTLNSIYILLKLNSNKLTKINYISNTDLSQLINIEYNILQNTKKKYPIYNIKKQIFNTIKHNKLPHLYINITGIWENHTQCGLIYTIM